MACDKQPCAEKATDPNATKKMRPAPPPAPLVRHAWIDWIGIPLYIRQHCARRPAGRPLGSHVGCGCIRVAKDRCESWWHAGGLRQLVARKAWKWMPRLSRVLSYGLGVYLSLRLPVSARTRALLDHCTTAGYRPRCNVSIVRIEGAGRDAAGRPVTLLSRQEIDHVRAEALKVGRSVGEAIAEATVAKAKAAATSPSA